MAKIVRRHNQDPEDKLADTVVRFRCAFNTLAEGYTEPENEKDIDLDDDFETCNKILQEIESMLRIEYVEEIEEEEDTETEGIEAEFKVVEG